MHHKQLISVVFSNLLGRRYTPAPLDLFTPRKHLTHDITVRTPTCQLHDTGKANANNSKENFKGKTLPDQRSFPSNGRLISHILSCNVRYRHFAYDFSVTVPYIAVIHWHSVRSRCEVCLLVKFFLKK